MAKQRSSFAKLQRDKAKKEKAEERLAARQSRNAAKKSNEVVEIPEAEQEPVSVLTLVAGDGEPSPDELLRIVEDLNSRKESGSITNDEFEEAKVELFARLEGL